MILVFMLSACSSEWFIGDGRGDWTLDISNGYAISKINSYEILLVYKENPSDSGGSIILSNYFIKAYQFYDPYLCLEGICTQEIAISQDELIAAELSYFLVNTNNGEIVGPFESYNDFAAYCGDIVLKISNNWIRVKD